MDLYLPAEERRQIIRDYGQKYNLSVLIESGTNNGDTPWELKDDFEKIYTIELDSKLYKAAKIRFRDIDNITCIYGDSGELLKSLLEGIGQSTLLWLDGHCSGPGTAHGALSTPIRKEVLTVVDDLHPHIALIDDARIFDGEPEHHLYPHYADYPSLRWIKDLASVTKYEYTLANDIVRLVHEDFINV